MSHSHLSVILIASTFFIPETPRWLYNNGHPEKAQAFLQKYHGSGGLTTVVQMEYHQIETSVLAARAKGLKRWDFGSLAKTRGNKYRLMLGQSYLVWESGLKLLTWTSTRDGLLWSIVRWWLSLFCRSSSCLASSAIFPLISLVSADSCPRYDQGIPKRYRDRADLVSWLHQSGPTTQHEVSDTFTA